ncbi:MAG: hypothetical protein IT537_01845 [Hyphomicrobiales bacterium]|nr:hypothetical protein [Hyphomicrobiales bacterium]
MTRPDVSPTIADPTHPAHGGTVDYDFFRRRARALRRETFRAWSAWLAGSLVRLFTTRLIVSSLLIVPAHGLEPMAHVARIIGIT